MNYSELESIFYQKVSPSHPNQWELTEYLEPLLDLEPNFRDELLFHVDTVWAVSHSLCFSYLETGIDAIELIGPERMPEWIRQMLGNYESGGLIAARQFMSNVEENFLIQLEDNSTAYLEENRTRLITSFHGMSGLSFELNTAPIPWTDTRVIYLPDSLNYFDKKSDNELCYLFLGCCQWAYSKQGTFSSPEKLSETFLPHFECPEIALNLYHILEFGRACSMLQNELPGLMRRVQPLLINFITRSDHQNSPYQKLVLDQLPCSKDSRYLSRDTKQSCQLAKQLYPRFSHLSLHADLQHIHQIIGALQLKKIEQNIRKYREEEKKRFIEKLALLLIHQAEKSTGSPQDSQQIIDDATALILKLAEQAEPQQRPVVKHAHNNQLEVNRELTELRNRITADFGKVPESYIQSAAGMAGLGRMTGQNIKSSIAQPHIDSSDSQKHLYDEWDYRRQGYKKEWCTVIEKELSSIRSDFISNTLLKYKGTSAKLRRQFEMLRTSHRFLKRRRDGDEIDFDALVDNIGNQAAGQPGSDRLFIKLAREERDIAVIFLIDMSNSTEGWVGKAIKESLVLLCDVLHVVGDRYAIYGFSGMRRSRCNLYQIKEIEEPYSDAVQSRICAISPMEYTRMAPPVRHLTEKFATIDAKIRLLITLSDGKPEDYDDYQGQYAIEDTRKSLQEARGNGIIPFCITVDKEAHSYLSHMYGKGNYIYVNGVEKLPLRMAEIYRHLTS